MWRRVGCIALIVIAIGVTVAIVLKNKGEDGGFKISVGSRKVKEDAEPSFEPVRRGDIEIVVEASGTTEPITDIEVKSEATGRITDFLVEEGTKVKAGDVICKLDQTTQQLLVKQQRIAVERARLAYEQARSTETSTSRSQLETAVRSAQASVASAEEVLEKSSATLTRLEELHAKGYVTDQELENAQQSVASAKAQLDSARASLDNARTQLQEFDGSGNEASIEQTRLAYESAKVQLQDAERQLGKSTITSPIDGIILEKPLDVGDSVTSINSAFGQGTTVVKVANLRRIKVRTTVDEIDIGKIQIGQEAEVRVDSFPNEVFTGTVTNVFPQGVQTAAGIISFIAIVEVDNPPSASAPDGVLKGNMTTEVSIKAQTIKDQLLVPLSATRAGKKKDSTVVFVLKEGEKPEDPKAETEEREVKLGDTDFTNVVILEGLKEGEMVKVRGFEERIQFD